MKHKTNNQEKSNKIIKKKIKAFHFFCATKRDNEGVCLPSLSEWLAVGLGEART